MIIDQLVRDLEHASSTALDFLFEKVLVHPKLRLLEVTFSWILGLIEEAERV